MDSLLGGFGDRFLADTASLLVTDRVDLDVEWSTFLSDLIEDFVVFVVCVEETDLEDLFSSEGTFFVFGGEDSLDFGVGEAVGSRCFNSLSLFSGSAS